jgi:hypothetical protein
LFFSISFPNSFQVNLLNSYSNQIFFPNFSQNFIIFLEVTQATKKTMQSQIMMHNHLLSLY